VVAAPQPVFFPLQYDICVYMRNHNFDGIVMSSQKLNSLGRLMAIGTAALLIQIGGVAAANQRADIREQMRQVLSGAVPAHAASPAASARDGRSGSGADAQAFARRLLQGWNIAAVADGPRAQQPHRVTADSGKHADIQAMIRRQILGG
jgi:hypothetical protein